MELSIGLEHSTPATDSHSFQLTNINQINYKDDTNYYIAKLSDIQFSAVGAQAALLKEFSYATFIGSSIVIFPFQTDAPIDYARFVNSCLLASPFIHIWLRIPLLLHSNSSWKIWNQIRNLCNHNPRLSICLDLNTQTLDPNQILQWKPEPVRCVVLPKSSFIDNPAGFPVLSTHTQSFIINSIKNYSQFVISGNSSNHKDSLYIEYLWYLKRTIKKTNNDEITRGYHDYLQAPLQPLQDHLESSTYACFEQDPIKYQEYENAIFRALSDITLPVITLIVVGAGRGPLVSNSLNAAKRSGKNLKIYAVEKNPNAVIVLKEKNKNEWNNRVNIIEGDMRYLSLNEKADILVSELLGSFGDNELSPECLDGAQKFLKPNGISIPSSYTSFVTPISSTKLYNEVINLKAKAENYFKVYETCYVVLIKQALELAKPQPLFTFTHPNKREDIEFRPGQSGFNLHNTRYKKLTFDVETCGDDGVLMHGFAGYFEATLYKDVKISILPSTHSSDMLSWFPIYFPIRNPFHLKKGSNVDIHIWRLTNAKKVWYEWSFLNGNGEIGAESIIHNMGGNSNNIGL